MSFRQKYKWLAPMFIFIGGLLTYRVIRTHTIMFLFIPWNLLLAAVPLYISYRLRQTENKRTSAALFAAWLLFFPNAPYIITDLFHLQQRPSIPLWYDLILLFSSAVLGVIVGFLSLVNIERYLAPMIKERTLPWVILCFFMLCGYGIYLGRYPRWNSWDVIAQPFSLFADILQDIIHPFRNKECWMLTVLFGTWLYMLYRYFKKMRSGTAF